MTTWTEQQLTELDAVGEIRVAGRRDDGTLRPLVIIWHVVVDGVLYARSVRGGEGRWFRGVEQHWEGAITWRGGDAAVRFARDADHDPAIDAAYRAKYGTGSAVRAITSAVATATTLRIDPR
ncbi:MAG: DUF2255 family protein [Microbacteriaceae bacterium]